MGVKDYDLNPDNNTQINGINIAEGCPPSGINNAMRQLMADVKEDSDAQNTAIEALETKAETPASAEELGPVKVGDGLKMGEDGTLSLDLVDGVDSTSTTQAPTAAAVKTAYDKAVEAQKAADAAGEGVKSYISETWKSGQSWYRKYSDGFIEQGGFISIGSSSEVTTTFFVPFTVLPHISLGGVTNYGASTPDYKRHPLALTTSYFKTQSLFTDNTAVNRGAYWFACGY